MQYLQEQCVRYPALTAEDLLKGLHQSVFGCGHFAVDEEAALALIRSELETEDLRAELEPLDGPYFRLHLGYLKASGLAPETLARLFLLSAQAPAGTAAELEERLAVLADLAAAGRIPVSPEELEAAAAAWRQEGFPARHHSRRFRETYHPVYRVLRKEFRNLLPLLAAIDCRRRKQERVLVALEGGSASGKTTLAALLERIYDCQVFHMDDFFLRPEQRTEERLAEPGGNVDRERFAQEVLEPLVNGRTVTYRPYDCHTGTLLPPVTAAPKGLAVVEGAYSMHPELASQYDLSAFLRIRPELQRSRILKRNGPEMAERFFRMWIPLEQTYFEKTAADRRCDLILEVEA